DPTPVKHPLIDPVAHNQAVSREPCNSRQPQQVQQGVRVVRIDSLSRPDLSIQVEQARQLSLAAEESIAYEDEVVVPLPRSGGEKQLTALLVDVLGGWGLGVGGWCGGLLGDSLAETL